MKNKLLITLICIVSVACVGVMTILVKGVKNYIDETEQHETISSGQQSSVAYDSTIIEDESAQEDTVDEDNLEIEKEDTSFVATNTDFEDSSLEAYYRELEAEKDSEYEVIYEELAGDYKSKRFYSYEHNISFELPYGPYKIGLLDDIEIEEQPTQIIIKYRTRAYTAIQIYPEQFMPSFKSGWDFLTREAGKAFYLVNTYDFKEEDSIAMMRVINAWIASSLEVTSLSYPTYVTDASVYPYIVQGNYVKDARLTDFSKSSLSKILTGQWIIESDEREHYTIHFETANQAVVTSRHTDPIPVTYTIDDGKIQFDGEQLEDPQNYSVVTMTKNKIVLNSKQKRVSPLVLYREGTTTRHEDMHPIEVLHNYLDFTMKMGYEEAAQFYGTEQLIKNIQNEISHDLNGIQMKYNTNEKFDTYYVYLKNEKEEQAHYTIIRYKDFPDKYYYSFETLNIDLAKEDGIWKVDDVYYP